MQNTQQNKKTSRATAVHDAVGEGGVRMLVLAAFLLTLWALVTGWCDKAQFGDNVEQYMWSKSMEWGYHKHPPLPTWILGAVVALFKPAFWWPQVLANLCVICTLCLTWDITRKLAGTQVANVGALGWTLLQYFSSGIQLYNHNTVMVLCIAAVVWFCLKTNDHWAWWLPAGVGVAASLLAKYQSVIPLMGILGAVWLSGGLKEKPQRFGLLGSIVLVGMLFAPHLIWLVQHDFTTLRYASQSMSSPSFLARLQSLTSFLANQIRVAFPLLVALGIYEGWMRVMPLSGFTGFSCQVRVHDHVKAWVRSLFLWPLLALFGFALFGGVTLRNHWGVQVLQFLGLPLAMWLCSRRLVNVRRFAMVVCVVQLIALALYIHKQSDPEAMRISGRRLDTMYPARSMSDAALTQWKSVTLCPLRYVSGDFEAGLVALYANEAPAVYVNPKASPWITDKQLAQYGAVHVVTSADALPSHAVVTSALSLTPDGHDQPGFATIFLGVTLPEKACVSNLK